MRIAFICPLLPPHYNGCGDATDRLAREFQQRGCSTLVLTDDVETITHAYPAQSIGSWDIRSVVETKRRLDAFRPDVVLMQYTPFLYHPRSSYPFLAMKALSAYRRITYVHECFYSADSAAVRSRAKAAYLTLRDKAVVAASDTIYVASPQRASALLERAPYARHKIRVVPFGANIEPLAPLPARRTAQAPFRLVAFGIVMPRRRIELLIQTVAALRDAGIEASLDVIGRVQEAAYQEQCEAIALDLAVAERIRFRGAVPPPELEAAFARADVFLHAAEEGAIASAGSLLAALAHGVPVLCARTPHDDARFADAAIFADADASSMAGAFESALCDPEQLRRRGALSRALYDQEFGWARMADRIASEAQLRAAS